MAGSVKNPRAGNDANPRDGVDGSVDNPKGLRILRDRATETSAFQHKLKGIKLQKSRLSLR